MIVSNEWYGKTNITRKKVELWFLQILKPFSKITTLLSNSKNVKEQRSNFCKNDFGDSLRFCKTNRDF